MQRQRFHSIDALRGVTILVIVVYHTYDATLLDYGPLFVAIKYYGGYFGNYIFFMLSGFLTAYAYRERIVCGGIGFKAWVIKRLKKIYPLFFITNVIMFASCVVFDGLPSIDVRSFALIFLMQGGGALVDVYPYNIATWFVCSLMVCYVVYFIIAKLTRRANAGYIVALIALVLWGSLLIRMNWSFPYSYVHTGEGLSNFFLGALLAEAYSRCRGDRQFVIAVASFLWLVLAGSLLMFEGVRLLVEGFLQAFVTFAICPAVILLCLSSKAIATVSKFRPINWIGVVSLSVYFWHLVVWEPYMRFNLLASLGVSPSLVYLSFFVLLLLVASASHYVLEPKIARAMPAKTEG